MECGIWGSADSVRKETLLAENGPLACRQSNDSPDRLNDYELQSQFEVPVGGLDGGSHAADPITVVACLRMQFDDGIFSRCPGIAADRFVLLPSRAGDRSFRTALASLQLLFTENQSATTRLPLCGRMLVQVAFIDGQAGTGTAPAAGVLTGVVGPAARIRLRHSTNRLRFGH